MAIWMVELYAACNTISRGFYMISLLSKDEVAKFMASVFVIGNMGGVLSILSAAEISLRVEDEFSRFKFR